MATQYGMRIFVFLAAWLISWAGPAWSQFATSQPAAKGSDPGSEVVLTVGDHKLTAAQVERIIDALPPESRAFYGGQGKKYLPVYLVRMAVLSDEAQKHDLQADPQVQQAIQNATEAILAHAEQERIEKTISISEQQLRDLYEQKKGTLQETRIRRILIRTANSAISGPDAPSRPALPEAEARKKIEDLRKQILGGADFAQLAQKYSEDLATARAGGDMGYINRQVVVPPIADAAAALNLGQVSDIIRTPYGLELIKVEEHRVKPFSEARAGLEAEFHTTKTNEAIQSLIDQRNVVIDKRYFTSNPQASSAAPSTSQ
jgi:parvulin-like peptidyl-prolyl isomerase